MSVNSRKAGLSPTHLIEKIPSIRYDTYFAMFGMLSVQANVSPVNPIQAGALRAANGVRNDGLNENPDISNLLKRTKLRHVYCRLVNLFLWLMSLRSSILLFIRDRNLQLYMGDFTHYWNDYQMYYLFPMFFLSMYASITSTLFLNKQDKLEWLVPFFSVRQTLSMHQHSDRFYRITTRDFKIRIYLGIAFGMVSMHREDSWLITIQHILLFTHCFLSLSLQTYIAVVTSAVGMTYFETAQVVTEVPFAIAIVWTVVNSIWFFYMAGTLVFTMLYFNLVCKVIGQRFHHIAKDIERLTEQDTATPQAKCAALNSLYFEHNEVCELVDESNSFWAAHIFNSYAIFIPGACYALYCLFFAQWDPLLSATLWSVMSTTVAVVGFISLSAAGVASEVTRCLGGAR